MSADSEPASPRGPDPAPSAQLDPDAYAEMFDAHAAHLFDYCNSLLGDEAEAASVTELALTTAQSLLQNDDRLRAWLFALARRECLNVNGGGADGLTYAASTEVGDDEPAAEVSDPDLADTADLAVQQVLTFSALTDPAREVRDLVYRHRIRPEDLPTILGVTADHANELLTAAKAEFSRTEPPAQAEEADPGLSRWQEELTESGPTVGRLRPAASLAQARQRLKAGAALLVLVAAAVAAVIYVLGPSHSPVADHAAGSPRTATSDPPGTAANGLLPVPGRSSTPRVQISALLPGRAKNPVYLVLQEPTSAKPTASKTAKPKPTTSTSTAPASGSGSSSSDPSASDSSSGSSSSGSTSPSASPSASPDPGSSSSS